LFPVSLFEFHLSFRCFRMDPSSRLPSAATQACSALMSVLRAHLHPRVPNISLNIDTNSCAESKMCMYTSAVLPASAESCMKYSI
jgi:hypothetical protein